MTATVTHVVVGFGGILHPLDGVLPERSVAVLEEPEMIERRELDRSTEHSCVGRLVAAPTQAEEDPGALFAAVTRPPGLRAVIPANEYNVVAAARLADRWGLPGAGVPAARAFRDKARLRQAADGALPQPAWHLADGPDAVVELRARLGGACVVKPANRQASLGVSLLDENDPDDAARDAWWHAVQVDESSMRTSHMPPPRVLVEQRLRGPEVSVEVLVSRGRVVFRNVTAKLVQDGRYPVEVGQSLPAGLPRQVDDALDAAVRALVVATGYGDGVLHAEWILTGDGRPHLVECAARMPGDNIKDLIDLAYGGDLIADYVRVLEGADPGRPADAKRGAAVRFVSHRPGTVQEVTGVDAVSAADGVQEVHISAEPGMHVDAARSSWQRAGHVMVTAATGPEAAELAGDLVRRIHVVTRPDP